MILEVASSQCHTIQNNKNQNRSIDKVQKLRKERSDIHKLSPRFRSHNFCVKQDMWGKFLPKFIEIQTPCSQNMAAGNQQKYLIQ